jgi:hypothetical protein
VYTTLFAPNRTRHQCSSSAHVQQPPLTSPPALHVCCSIRSMLRLILRFMQSRYDVSLESCDITDRYTQCGRRVVGSTRDKVSQTSWAACTQHHAWSAQTDAGVAQERQCIATEDYRQSSTARRDAPVFCQHLVLNFDQNVHEHPQHALTSGDTSSVASNTLHQVERCVKTFFCI